MDYASLGRTLAELEKNLPLPDSVKVYVADAVDGLKRAADRQQENAENVRVFVDAFVKAHEPEGWEAAVDEVEPSLQQQLDYIIANINSKDWTERAWYEQVRKNNFTNMYRNTIEAKYDQLKNQEVR